MGADLDRGFDAAARAWAASGGATTYHFLDLNLEEDDDLEPAWIAETAAAARSVGAAWLCGDAGLWHVGPRDRGHGTLLPPILTRASAEAMAENVRRLRLASGFEVLPENPPAHVYLGDWHLLDYFACVAERADAGLLLDVAHLAIHQRATGRTPLDGLDRFPLDRVVEVHVAGATEFEHAGRRFLDDDHGPEPVPDTWEILDYVLSRATNLRALVYECERNRRAAVLANFERLAKRWADRGADASRPSRTGVTSRVADARLDRNDVRAIQRTLVRMQHDAAFAARLRADDAAAIASTRLAGPAIAMLRAADPIAVAADREGRRTAQLLRNVASEFRCSCAVGPEGDGDASFVAAFASSALFHEAIAADGNLVLAFASHAEAHAGAKACPSFRALVALEASMARARRAPLAAAHEIPRGAVGLAPGARLLALPAGTHAAAATLATSRDPVDPTTLPAVDARARETLVLHRKPGPAPRFGRL
ncbi:MAG: DUF692 family protein, partial [Myxococcota bacterium]|nr:DUF692 family protein [Myxococcota bacterium]